VNEPGRERPVWRAKTPTAGQLHPALRAEDEESPLTLPVADRLAEGPPDLPFMAGAFWGGFILYRS
jgi:hypothetical protein